VEKATRDKAKTLEVGHMVCGRGVCRNFNLTVRNGCTGTVLVWLAWSIQVSLVCIEAVQLNQPVQLEPAQILVIVIVQVWG